MKTPKLETERLILRLLTSDDAGTAYRNWTGDPDVAKFMRWAVHKDAEETRQWLASDELLVESDRVYNWGFVLKSTGELIGSGGLVFMEDRHMFELGYCIMKKYWNLGLATEAAKAIIDFGKQELKENAFYCCHAKDNPASGKVMRKIGFKYQNDGVYYSWDREKKFESMEYLLVSE